MGTLSRHSSIAGPIRTKKSKPRIRDFAVPGSVTWNAICAAKSYYVDLCFGIGFFFLSVGDPKVSPLIEDAIALANEEFNIKLQVNPLKKLVGFKYSG